MGLLDFIKKRNAQQQTVAPAPQPETAKQMYTREAAAAQQKSGQKPIALSPEGAAAAKTAGDLFRQGTQPNAQQQSSPAPASQEGATAPQPMAQLSMSQDKAAPALSPTSAQQGSRSNEQEKPSAPAQDQAKRTLPRATPSWER